ncbi:MAG: hypothetical protein RLZZ444_1304 [Pseudomonadota bacterium]|jgi:ribose transport system permease protein
MRVTLSERLDRWRFALVPDHVVGELLSKRWIENLVPFTVLVVVLVLFGNLIPDFFASANLSDTMRQFGEYGLVALAMTIVMIGGGIDLSVGSTFALANITMLILTGVFGWSLDAAIPTTLAICGLVGLCNGILVGYLRLRAFLTTLVTLIVVRALVDILLLNYSVAIAGNFFTSPVWDFIGYGSIWVVPSSMALFGVLAIAIHIMLTRLRLGWHIKSVGGSRRGAHNVGVPVRRTVCFTYVFSGILAGMAGILYAARLGSAGADTGFGLEVAILTGVVLGGNSLGGGRGSVAKAAMGTLAVLIITNGVVALGLKSGATQLMLGLVLLCAIAIDVKWLKNRHKFVSTAYMAPTYFRLQDIPDTSASSASVYAMNNRLRDVELIGLGQLEGPEDVIFDRHDNLYTGTRLGDILRFRAPDYDKPELFAHIGGHPLGMAMDNQDRLHVCVSGMGLYLVDPDGRVSKQTDETNRSWTSIVDDSPLKLADDLDIAPDGSIWFSEATIRYSMEAWADDALESRGNGRLIRYDPKTNTTRTMVRDLVFPNGVCLSHDGRSLLFAESWGCRIKRYWLDGPKKGQVDEVIPNLPGYPDNINRASDGTYWLALLGMRTPALDVAMRMPRFRKKMARQVAPNEWLYPNINTGCVMKFDENGTVLDVLWDAEGLNHPNITSMREHKGWLYLGGVSNNRIGRIRLPDADPQWTGHDSYWGDKKKGQA